VWQRSINSQSGNATSEPTAFSGDDLRLEQIRNEQIRALYDNAALGVIGALTASLILAAILLYFHKIPDDRIYIWLLATIVSALWQLLICHRYNHIKPPAAKWKKWARLYSTAAFAEGLRWGLGSVWLSLPPAPMDQQLWVVLVLSSASSASVASIGAYLPAFYALMFSSMLPYALWSATQRDAAHLALILLDIVFMAAVAVLAARSNGHLVEALNLRFENSDLAEDLKRQKELAERASLEKSYFLASASHDLRQPVHALGLFVGALQNQPMSETATDLIKQIENSISALDGLFHALLDIAQLDAGVVRHTPQVFAIQTLLERIYRDHVAAAADKGLKLHLKPCSMFVRTDPILMERVLRNIVSNAVRYTTRGGIVIGCRRLAGFVRVEVWDTGAGIEPHQQIRIFEEFYQIENPERDRSQGLGLGLAIVRRVTALLDCPLTFASVFGRGSVFKVTIPITETTGYAATNAPTPIAEDCPGLILIIDDETAIRQAMFSLLSSWGHDVICAGSYDELSPSLTEIRQRPTLIICDYRLRNGESGLDVITQLREEFNEDIPALLITGDTAPERLREAEVSGYPILYKPIASSRLRAIIRNLCTKPQDAVVVGVQS